MIEWLGTPATRGKLGQASTDLPQSTKTGLTIGAVVVLSAAMFLAGFAACFFGIPEGTR